MKLQFIDVLYWYDGPLCELYINEYCELYATTVMNDDYSISLARKLDRPPIYEDGIGITFPHNFWEEEGVEYLILDINERKLEKQDYMTTQVLVVDGRVATQEELQEFWKP